MLTTVRNWFKKLAPFFHPIRSKTKTNRDSLVRIFPRFASATCNYFAFWLVHLIICALCDWLEWLLWFWFYDTQLKTALSQFLYHEVTTSICTVLSKIDIHVHVMNGTFFFSQIAASYGKQVMIFEAKSAAAINNHVSDCVTFKVIILGSTFQFSIICLTKSMAFTIFLKGFPFHWEKSAELCLNFRITCLSWNREGKNQHY